MQVRRRLLQPAARHRAHPPLRARTSRATPQIVLDAAFRAVMPPYLAVLSLLQLPLAGLMRSPLSACAAGWATRVGVRRGHTPSPRHLPPPTVKGKRLGNLVVWAGLTFGVTLLLTLYARAKPLFAL